MSAWALVGNRLALGVEPRDAVLGSRLTRAIHVDVERPGAAWLREDSQGFVRAAGRDRAPMSRNDSGRHSMIWRDDLGAAVQVRMYDRRRIWVPRRLAIPLPPSDVVATAGRIRRPVVFPGVAWDLVGGATALRSRVQQGGAPVRWAWLFARRPGEAEVVMRARADDRGEFLLVLGPATLAQAELDGEFELDIEAFAPISPSPALDGDPLGDLLVETLAAPGDDDPVAEGRADPPDDWMAIGIGRVTLELGRTVSDQVSLAF